MRPPYGGAGGWDAKMQPELNIDIVGTSLAAPRGCAGAWGWLWGGMRRPAAGCLLGHSWSDICLFSFIFFSERKMGPMRQNV